MRSVPRSGVIAFGAWIVWLVARLLWMTAATDTFSPVPLLISEGIGFAAEILVLLYALEMVSRGGPNVRFFKVAAGAVSVVVATGFLIAGTLFTKEPYEHEWIFKTYEYVTITAWTVFALALVQAIEPAQRSFGYAAVFVALLGWLPPVLGEPIGKALGHGSKQYYVYYFATRALRLAALGWLTFSAGKGETPARPELAAGGLRSAARGLWTRVIGTIIVVLFTMTMIVGRSGNMSVLQLMTIIQAVVSIIALVVLGLGTLRAARAGIRDLDGWTLTLSGGSALWAAGVSLQQLPYLYSAIYRPGTGSDYSTKYLQSLSLTMPLVVALGVGLLATALAGFGARRGNEQLRNDAQGKGILFIVLMLVGIAIQKWGVPDAKSASSYVLLMLLGAAGALAATVAMAKLLARGAEAIEAEPGLPPANLVSDAPSGT